MLLLLCDFVLYYNENIISRKEKNNVYIKMYSQTVVGDEAVDEFREKLFGEFGSVGL